MTHPDKESFSIIYSLKFGTHQSQSLPCVQTPVGKRAKKASSKVLSPMPSQMAPPTEAEKPGDKVSPPDIVPHIVLNVTGKDYPSATELLKGNTLPPLEEVWPTIAYFFPFLYLVWFPVGVPQI